MDFKDLLLKLHEERKASEAFQKTTPTLAKERAKSASSDQRAKDAARKRAERAGQIKREKKSPNELIKEVIAVRTKSGRVQLIFKDSFNPELHTKLSDKELTLGDANKIVGDPNFEQTRASKLLFGNVKEKPKGEKEEGKKEEEKKAPREGKKEEEPVAKKTPGAPEEQKAPKKAKKLSPEEIQQQLSMMTPEQLATVPLELRQQFFMSLRNPMPNKDFDHVASSYEDLSMKFGINPSSSLPYNQQVLNALMFLAKLKAGASQQEMETYKIMSPAALEFTGSAFAQARKILSQLGDNCIQALLSSMESGIKTIEVAGASDMQCGNYRFKVSAGGEIALSTNSFDQSNKSFRGYLARALASGLEAEMQKSQNPKVQELAAKIQEVSVKFPQTLISKQSLPMILSNKQYVKELQNARVSDDQGNDLGPIIDENGNLNPAATYENYVEGMNSLAKDGLKTLKSDKQAINQIISADVLKTFLRGDQAVQPEMAPTHVITMNGVFQLSDDYISEISKYAVLDIKPAKDVMNTNNIQNYNPSAAGKMKSFATIIEQNEKVKMPSLKELMISKSEINPFQILAGAIVNQNDFNFNASLLPGFKPGDLNTVEYNYVTIGKKTIKIPVITNDQASIQQMMVGEAYEFANDIIVESLTNNFVLSSMIRSQLINEVEATVLFDGPISLLESADAALINMKTIVENVTQRLLEEPVLLNLFVNILLDEETKRNYAKEYRNYQGSREQKKKRAARTRARYWMEKKGVVKKGDGKDIDHKRPLRSNGSNGINNLRVRSRSTNRADNGHKKGEKQKKDWK
jgi:hypothetical protein